MTLNTSAGSVSFGPITIIANSYYLTEEVNLLRVLQVGRGGRLARGWGFGMTCPEAFEIRTFVPSSRYRRATFVGLLK